MMLAHWTGIYWNGQELGFKVFKEVVRRLHARFDDLIWMKLSELARYWAARELTRIERDSSVLRFRAPFVCPEFTLRIANVPAGNPRLRVGAERGSLTETGSRLQLAAGRWWRDGAAMVACFHLPKGESSLELQPER
jgi:hypothetical protein